MSQPSPWNLSVTCNWGHIILFPDLKMGFPKTVTKLAFRYYSLMCAYAVSFHWEEDAYLQKVTGFRLLIWYFQQFCNFCTCPVFALNLWTKWDDYVADHRITQLVINMFYLIVHPLGYTFQQIFWKHGDEVIGLVNQSVRLSKHFQTGKHM